MKRQLHYINIQLPRIILIISSSIPIGSTGSGTSASPRKLSSPAPPPKSLSSSSSISPPQKQQTNIIQHTKKVIPSGRQPSVHTLLSSLNSMAFFIDLFQFSMTLSLAVIYKKLLNSLVFRYFWTYMSVQQTKGMVSTKLKQVPFARCLIACLY